MCMRKILICCCCGCCCKKREGKTEVVMAEAETKEFKSNQRQQKVHLEDLQEAEDEYEDDTNENAQEEEANEEESLKEEESFNDPEEESFNEPEEEFLKEPDTNSEYILSKFSDDIKQAITKECPLNEAQCINIVLVGYTSQFVAGTDYYLKIFEPVSGNYFHIRIYESLQGDLILQRMSGPKTSTDKIIYF